MQGSNSLSQRVIRGGIWVFVLNLTTKGLTFLRTIILARLLLPVDFGLVGIAGIAMSALNVFTHTGLGEALIQKKEEIKDYLDTAWSAVVIRGIALTIILFLSASAIAWFFKNEDTKIIMQVIAIAFVLEGFTNIGIMYFHKELYFQRYFILKIGASVVGLAVSISLAFILRNVWAIVYGTLAGTAGTLVLSYILHPYRPKFKIEINKLKELFRFGKWILGLSILTFLLFQGDNIFVGKLLGVSALGLYQMAYGISKATSTEIAEVISQVTFPAYAKLQDNLAKLREGYLKVLEVTAFIFIPLAVGMFILAPQFTEIFLGTKWLPMVPTFQVLCIFGALRTMMSTNEALLKGVGKPKIVTKWETVQLILMIGGLYPLITKFGILGASIAVVIPIFITQIFMSKEVLNVIRCEFPHFIKLFLFPLGGAIIMGMVILLIMSLWDKVDIAKFSLLVGLGVIVYFAIEQLFMKMFKYEGTETMIQQLKQIRK